MGAIGSTFVHAHFTEVDVTPDRQKPPTYDPLLGFPNGRKKREFPATKEEMVAAKVPLGHRDYCVNHLLSYWKCYNDWFPFVQRKCAHDKHIYLTCEYEDFILRMKEYERERRLKKRDKRIKAKCREEMGDV